MDTNLNKNNNFTMIHIVAAIMVIIGHQCVLTGNAAPIIMNMEIHGLGVRVLFLVSGYLVSASYLRRRNPLKFLGKRIYRLYPQLILCLLITVIGLRFVTSQPAANYWQSALKYFLHNIEMRPKFDLAGVFADNPFNQGVNGSLWTLPIELTCYLLLIPTIELYELLKRIHINLSYIFMLALLIGLTFIDAWHVVFFSDKMVVWWDTDWFNLVSLGIWFFIGVLFSLIKKDHFFNWQMSLILVVVFSCAPHIVRYIITPYFIGYIVICFGKAEKPLFGKLFKRDICYGLYLFSFPIQQLLISYFFGKINNYVLFLISITLIILFAELSYYLIENKIDKEIKKIKSKDNRRNNKNTLSHKD